VHDESAIHTGRALCGLVDVALHGGHYDEALDYLRTALAQARASGSQPDVAQALLSLGVDEAFLFRKNQKRYLYRAVDEGGVVVDVLLREHRDTASAEAFFRQAIERSGVIPSEVVTDHHQPYVRAVATTCPGAQHIRTGLHRARGETTKAIERSHVLMRDRLRNSRGLKRTETGQRFLEGFETVRHLRVAGQPEPATWSGASPPRARSGGRGGDPRPRHGLRRQA